MFKIPDFRNAVIVARNPNSVKRVTSFAERLRLSIAVIHGEEKDEDEPCDGRTSPPLLMQEADFGINPIPGMKSFNVILCTLEVCKDICLFHLVLNF